MSRALDHIIIMTRDLQSAAQTFEELGFYVCPLMRHPFGTANRLVMFGSSFIELLGIEEPEKLTSSFAPFQDYLAGGEGFYGLSLKTDDAEGDRQALLEAGSGPGPVAGFRRAVALPDGTPTEAVVSTVWAEGLRTPRSAYFLCQQHRPEAIWVPEWSHHDNGAKDLEEVVLAAPDPEARARELEGVMGGEAEMAPNGDMVFTTPLGRLRVTKASPEQKGEIFRSVSVQVQSIDKARNLLTPSKVDIEADGDEIVLRPDHCGGTLLRFREKGSS